jgi:hypothetical protein
MSDASDVGRPTDGTGASGIGTGARSARIGLRAKCLPGPGLGHESRGRRQACGETPDSRGRRRPSRTLASRSTDSVRPGRGGLPASKSALGRKTAVTSLRGSRYCWRGMGPGASYHQRRSANCGTASRRNRTRQTQPVGQDAQGHPHQAGGWLGYLGVRDPEGCFRANYWAVKRISPSPPSTLRPLRFAGDRLTSTF